jgi:hypothetical protein
MIESSSRYFRIPEEIYVTQDGEQILYKRRRIPPTGSSLATQAIVPVQPSSDRLDLIANRTLGSPLLFWRIADANDAMNPFDLVERSQLKIPPIRA